jgi:uncharacterized damage-inducible protein DinB
MRFHEFFAEQMEREAAVSKRVLERVPEGKPDWKPHEKSMPFGYLSQLVATMPSWITMAVTQDALDLNPPSGAKYSPPRTDTTAELLSVHERLVQEAIRTLRGTTDDFLETKWKLLVGGNVVMEEKRRFVIADSFTHLAHHRGQLTVYLRLLGAQVPRVYGPSADDRSF